MRAGAISYLLKDVEPDGHAAAIRKAALREAVLTSGTVQDLQGLRRQGVNPFSELSEQKFDILGLIAAGRLNADESCFVRLRY